MAKRTKFALALALVYLPTLLVVALVAAGVRAGHDPALPSALAAVARQHAALVIVLPLALLAVQGVLLHFFFRQYLTSPLEVAERLQIILDSNPSCRIAPTGGPELQALERVVNELAARHQALQGDVQRRIEEAQAGLEREKSLLAAVISQLAQGVLVCNSEGRILLYNERSAELLSRREGDPATPEGGLVGLGRSVFAIFDRSLVVHALDTIRARLEKGEPGPVAAFVGAVGARLVRAQLAPVVGTTAAPGRAGFVLVVDDVTAAVEAGARDEASLRSLLEASRRAAANVRAAVETVLAYPDLEARQRLEFLEVIREEVARLGATVGRVAGDHAAGGSAWLLEEMLAADLVSVAARRIEDELAVRAVAGAVDPSLWLKVDGHALVRALTAMARRLRDEAGVRELHLACTASGRLAQVDLAWSGPRIAEEALARWEAEPLEGGAGAAGRSLGQVLDRHDGEVLHVAGEGGRGGVLRLLLPVHERARPAPPRARAAARPRPEFYDFDLLQPSPATDLEHRRLAELTYTAFDTETTGMDPSSGDEILAIGAVRIVNGRLLRGEVFEQLVDPRRPVSLETIAVTGVDPAALRGQPSIAAVLPRFHAFCADTVLVAHNASFDLRFLQLKEKATGVRFAQPVLDTLLLAAALQPGAEPLGLDALAERFGVDTMGRHTALGDAIMTGELFLRMLPLLAERGIVTLGEAREASRRTRQARIRY